MFDHVFEFVHAMVFGNPFGTRGVFVPAFSLEAFFLVIVIVVVIVVVVVVVVVILLVIR